MKKCVQRWYEPCPLLAGSDPDGHLTYKVINNDILI